VRSAVAPRRFAAVLRKFFMRQKDPLRQLNVGLLHGGGISMGCKRVLFTFLMLVLVLIAACPTAIAAVDGGLGMLFDPLGIFRHTGGRSHHVHRKMARSPVHVHHERTVAKATPGTTQAPQSDYWPRAFDDLFGFVFWTPGRDDFWSHGYADIVGGIFSPAGAAGQAADQTADQDTDADHRLETCKASTASVGSAGDQADDAILKYIDRRIEPAKPPDDVVNELRSALLKAEERVAPGCPETYLAAAAPERLKKIGDRLWLMRQAVLIVRMPLEKVYDALPSRQKGQIDGTDLTRPKCVRAGPETLSWPRDEIEQAIHPNTEQRAGLERLRMIMLQMGQWLSMSCPQQAPATARERLDLAGDRLNAMLYAARISGVALRNLYGSLDEEQKVNFQAIGRQQPNASRAANLR
jgi:hypothetical protein